MQIKFSKIQNYNSIKKFKKIVFRSLLGLILLLLALGIAINLPIVQTILGHYATARLNSEFKTNINVEKVSITIFGGVKLKNVLILDHHKDTLIYSNRIKTTILDWNKLFIADFYFGDVSLDGLIFNMKTYKNERESNLNYFIESFNKKRPPSKKTFILNASNVSITNGRFLVIDENRKIPKDVDFTKLNASISDFKILGDQLHAKIKQMAFEDHRGLSIEKLNGKFSYNKQSMKLDNLYLKTKNSDIIGNIVLNYDINKGDFSHFTDKVKFDVRLDKASIGTNDIRCFYNELAINQHFNIKGRIEGPLNNLRFSNLNFTDSKKSQIIGFINFKNLFPNKEQEFYMAGKFARLAVNYNDLVTLLPNVLGKSLPPILKKLGNVTMSGTTEVTTTSVQANLTLSTNLGKVKSDLFIKDMHSTANATYVGNVILNNFDIGTFLDRKDLRNVSLNVAIDGTGFNEKYLNTSIKGSISRINYNNYNFSNVDLNGKFKKGLYKGHVAVKDPNLEMVFDGLVDLSQKKGKYDFQINVAQADLKKINLMQDSISKFRGDVIVNVSGNSIDNLEGNVFINKANYQNVKTNYVFDDFSINSIFDDNRVRTITVNSADIVQGEIIGKYKFEQLRKLVANSLGSLYTNYKPTKVLKGQFLKFNFTIYNKIIEIFYPEISLGTNTVVKGSINGDNQEFKLNFNSPIITASNNTFENIRVAVDNKNPLYNAYIEMDSIKTKHYKIRDFSLINVTMKDTLFFRSEFRGGSKGQDYFNMNLYHTINKDNKNVIGFNKSEIKLKDYLWYLNENETKNNQILFDKEFKNFNFDAITLTHEDQEISLLGDIKGANYKDLNVVMKNVDLNQVTPTNSLFTFNGNVNADVHYKQDNAVYQPKASIQIENLNINKTELGNLNFDIYSDEFLKKFTVNSTIQNNFLKSLELNGNFEIAENTTNLDLNLKLDQFNLGILSNLGGEVLSNIRGFSSGNATITGNIKKPAITGRLFIDKAGINIPYLNCEYLLGDRSIVDLQEQKFLIRNNTLTDIKYNTKGTLSGSIEHNNFGDWRLDLSINSKRLLVLDTKDKEDTAYFGVAFIDGQATIKGPTDGLFIKVDAKSEKGSSLKIPINDAQSVSDNAFIHFLTAKEKFNLKKGIVDNSRNYKGLELEFDLDITPDAEVEVILDRNSGHGMKGTGNGTLLFKINTLGKFNMWGDFQAYEGTYNFRYGNIIDKKFTVKKGSYISWEGDPMKARLNIEAVYKTSANPALLLENSSYNKKVDVNVIIGVRGDLASPEPDFNFEFPTVSNVLKSEIEYKLNDKEVRQTQALTLLSTGSFLSAVGVNQSAFSSNLFETAKGLISGIVRSDDDKFKWDFDLVTADRTLGKETDGRFVTNFSSKVNDRITINGKIGVPFGGLSETAIVGNLEVLGRVNEDGTLNLRFFNKENEINYIGEGIGYTQGVGLSYEVDFDTFTQLFNKIFKNKILGKAIENNNDSTIPTKNNSKETKSNREAILPKQE